MLQERKERKQSSGQGQGQEQLSLNQMPARIHAGSRERSMQEELEKIVIYSDEEIKRLTQVIHKAEQREKNQALCFQSTIADLEQKNQEYRARLRMAEYEKGRRGHSGHQNRLGKGSQQTSQNNENVNTLNTPVQECRNQKCLEIQTQLKEECFEVVSSLQKIVHSLQIRSLNQEDNVEYQGWLNNLLVEKGKRKADEGRSSLSLLKKVQLKINQLQKALLQHNYDPKPTESLMSAMKVIEQKQAKLTHIPFLEKIDLPSRREEYCQLLNDSKASRDRILSRLDPQ